MAPCFIHNLPVGGFKLRPKKGVLEIESDALSSWCLLRHLWQTESHPRVDLCKTELSHQTEPVHGPGWQRQTKKQINTFCKYKASVGR